MDHIKEQNIEDELIERLQDLKDTFYFANNRDEHFSFDADEYFLPVCRHA